MRMLNLFGTMLMLFSLYAMPVYVLAYVSVFWGLLWLSLLSFFVGVMVLAYVQKQR